MTAPKFISDRLQRIGSLGGLERARRHLDESRRRNAAARRRRPADSVTEERALELQSEWRNARHLWIACHPRGADAAIEELHHVFAEENRIR